jgi:phosphatidylglycerophosphate synthase
VLERCLLALQRGGFHAVLLSDKFNSELAKVRKNAPQLQLDLHLLAEGSPLELPADGRILVLSEPLVLDSAIPAGLLKHAECGQELTVLADGNAAFLQGNILQRFRHVTFSDTAGPVQWVKMAEERNPSFGKLEFPGLLQHPVNSRESRREVESALVRSLIKPTDGWVSRHLNRPISTRISRVLAHTAVTPNQFTFFTGLIGLAAGVFAAGGGYWNYLMAGFLFHLTSVLDGVDGELARLKFKSSPLGQWLDTLVDNLSYLAALAGIIVGIYRTGASNLVLAAGALAAIFVVLALGSLYLYLLRFKSGGTLLNVKYSFQDGNSRFDRFMQTAAAFGKRDLFALIFFILSIFGQLPMALAYVAVMAFFIFIFSIQAHVKAARAK